MQLAPQACSLRLCWLDTELGRLATSASVRHSVWKRRARSFSLADRVGVALERCPGLPSCWRLARTSSRESGLWLEPSHESSQSRSSKVVYCRSEETTPVVERRRCGVRAELVFSTAQLAPTSERGWGASLNLTRSISLDARGRCGAGGADSERQRCRGRAARPRVWWFASRTHSSSDHGRSL